MPVSDFKEVNNSTYNAHHNLGAILSSTKNTHVIVVTSRIRLVVFARETVFLICVLFEFQKALWISISVQATKHFNFFKKSRNVSLFQVCSATVIYAVFLQLSKDARKLASCFKLCKATLIYAVFLQLSKDAGKLSTSLSSTK